MSATKIPTYYVVVVAIYVVVIVLFLGFVPNVSSYFSLPIRGIGSSVVIGVLAFAAAFFVLKLLHFGRIGFNRQSPAQAVALIFYAFVLFALPEEILFRGLAQTFLQAWSSNALIAIVASSAVYGLAHALNGIPTYSLKRMNWKLVVLTFLLGLFLGFEYFITATLFVPIILHGLLIVADQIFVKRLE